MSVRAGFAIFGAVSVVGACDAEVTSVGEWRPAVSAGFYVEAESGELSQGFTVEGDAAVSGGRYLASPVGAASDAEPGLARAGYGFDVPEDGAYRVYVRIHSPDVGHNRIWFNIDGGEWTLFRISTGDDWFWDALHDDRDYGTPLTFALDAGPHAITFADAVENVGIDRLYFTTGDEVPPGNDTPCKPPNSIRKGDVCIPSCGAQGGDTCGVDACSGRPALEAYDCDVCCVGP